MRIDRDQLRGALWALRTTVAVVLITLLVIAAAKSTIYRFKHPEKTQTQLILEWREWLLVWPIK